MTPPTVASFFAVRIAKRFQPVSVRKDVKVVTRTEIATGNHAASLGEETVIANGTAVSTQ
jgi:hypothetical protein